MALSNLSGIIRDLHALGVREGDTLLVHSSLGSLGNVEGGAKTVITALLRVLGDEGTLLMPALSYMDVSPEQPVFDVDRTPSCVGVIPETFRTTPRTIRSVHPTHSVCGVGPKAQKLLAKHLMDSSPVGPCSPFSLLRQVGGRVLMLGCGLRPNTSMHGIEELSTPPYLFLPERVRYVLRHGGKDYPVLHRRHAFHGYEQRYDRLPEVMPGGIVKGKVLQAESWLIEAEPMWEQVDWKLRADPLYFVDRRDS